MWLPAGFCKQALALNGYLRSGPAAALSTPHPPTNTSIFLHNQANEILHHKLTLNGYLAEFTGQSMDTITADTDRDFFMSAQEAVRRALLACVLASAYVLVCVDHSCAWRALSVLCYCTCCCQSRAALGRRLACLWRARNCCVCLAGAACGGPGSCCATPHALRTPPTPQVEYGLIDAVVSKPALVMA